MKNRMREDACVTDGCCSETGVVVPCGHKRCTGIKRALFGDPLDRRPARRLGVHHGAMVFAVASAASREICLGTSREVRKGRGADKQQEQRICHEPTHEPYSIRICFDDRCGPAASLVNGATNLRTIWPYSRQTGLVLSLFGTALWEVFPLTTLDGKCRFGQVAQNFHHSEEAGSVR